MKRFLPALLTLFLGFSPLICADVVEDVFAQGIKADLRAPVYTDGVLKTEQGGVITGPDFRIQAQKIVYTRKMVEGSPVYTIEAEGDLLMEFGESVFIGDRLLYDFQEKSGIIYFGRTMVEPWFFGGDEIHFCQDGSYVLYNGFVTTSENSCMNWEISADCVKLNACKDVFAKNIKFRICRFPVLWIPSLKANLDEIFDSPVRYYFRWGGRQGPRAGLVYEFFTWNRIKTFLRFDYRLKRGPGGGFEMHYKSSDHKTTWDSINYIAMDSSIQHNTSEKYRYRFEGLLNTHLLNDKVFMQLSYDKLSDKDMASDYNDYSFDLDIAGRTQLLLRRQEDHWISNFLTRLRVNNFQTIKQELPTFETSWIPFNIANTGVIADPYFKVSYLDFEYANSLRHDHDYNSTRVEFTPRFYRLFRAGPINVTPQAGVTNIFYGNSPSGNPRSLVLGLFGCEANTHLYRHYFRLKHTMTPYLNYQYYTYPTVSPNHHYIFDIEDGWYRLNMLRFGLQQSFYIKNNNNNITRLLYFDLHANAFFDTDTIPATVPKVYGKFIFNTTPKLRHTLETAWDFEKGKLDHFNFRNQWTLSADAALSFEYRHRDAYDWRKVDHDNFILDSFRSLSALRHSQLSDRRDTLLVHLFYRFHPNWAFELQSRQGWNRLTQPKYTEFEMDLLATLPSAWNVKFSYQHKENDDRLAIYFSLGKKRPNEKDCRPIIPFLEF